MQNNLHAANVAVGVHVTNAKMTVVQRLSVLFVVGIPNMLDNLYYGMFVI